MPYHKASGSHMIVQSVIWYSASCELQMLVACILRVTSCTYCASYELHLLCELRVDGKVRVGTQKCEVKPNV